MYEVSSSLLRESGTSLKRSAVTSPCILSSDQLKCDYQLLTVVGIGMGTRGGGESPSRSRLSLCLGCG